jgi:hypothetical protein
LPWLNVTRVVEGNLGKISNLFALCEVGLRLGQLDQALQKHNTRLELVVPYLEAIHVLDHITLGDILELQATKHRAAQLLEFLRSVMTHDPLTPSEVTTIREGLADLTRCLHDELEAMPVYLASQLRAYSMPLLVEHAEQVLDADCLKKIPKGASQDVNQAGRCLAFELPTAAGFHVMRAFEKVFRCFYKKIAGTDPGHRDVYHLIVTLRKHPNANQKTLDVIDQVRAHRNSTAHEAFPSIDEAIELFDIGKSAIVMMARDL